MGTMIPDKETHQFRRFVLDNVPVAMVTMDADLKITCFNRRAEKLTGYSVAEALGRPCHEILNSSLCGSDCPLQTVQEMGESATGIEAELTNLHGERIPVRIGTAAIENQQGDFIGYLEVIEDISREKTLLRERNNFLSMVAHDMKSPLVAMQGLMERLRAHHAEMNQEKMDAYLRTIIAAGDQLEKRIREFLEYSRQATGTIPLHLVAVDVSDLIDQLIKRHETRAAAKKITLRAIYRATAPLMADGAQLQRVFENLLDNAICYVQEGGEITITTEQGDNDTRIEVRDNGPGIAGKDLPYLFDPFHKGESSTGHGLGLAAARAIVRQHGGRIAVQSTPGQGARFTVTLPHPAAAHPAPP
ncbi:MAG: PAS domain-containing sensor histidine kinase [Thermodesulfobacteriota bacterium]